MINQFFKSMIGLLFVVLALLLLTRENWYASAATVIRGSVVILILLVGLLLTFLGLSELKSED
jgi:hypothetical protein